MFDSIIGNSRTNSESFICKCNASTGLTDRQTEEEDVILDERMRCCSVVDKRHFNNYNSINTAISRIMDTFDWYYVNGNATHARKR